MNVLNVARVMLILLSLAVIPACGGGGGGGTAPSPPASPVWTVMVYMDADNDLDLASPLDLEELRKAISSPSVNVILQYDTRSSTTQRFRVQNQQLAPLGDLGELDMSSPAVLKDFIASSVAAYPAQHYALILWNHGEGWKSAGKRVDSILEDWTNNNPKTPATANHLVAQGIRDALSQSGVKLDVLGIDACIMSTIEAAYEFRDLAGYLVSSQDLVQGFGWDYTDLLGRLAANPAMTGKDLALAMVDSYRAFAESGKYGYGDQTISAVALGSVDALARSVDSLSRSLMERMNNVSTRAATLAAITSARSVVRDFYGYTYADLGHLATLLGDMPGGADLRSALAQTIVANYRGSKRENANGLSIVFFRLPEAINYSTFDKDYRNYDAIAKTGDRGAFINTYNWDEMLALFYSLQYPELMK